MKTELIDWMGDDLRVVNAARVSFNKESEWEFFNHDSIENGVADGRAYLNTKDQKLLKYLADHSHWTPFSHPQITMRETVPIFVARQRFKHMVGFTYNEVSRRYVDDEPEFFFPTLWNGRAEYNKQGSGEPLDEIFQDFWYMKYEEFLGTALNLYSEMIKGGVAPEQARMVLPQSTYTSYYVTGSLAAWARAYKLRSDSHAQKEIRDLASMWNEIIAPLFPYSWKALTNVDVEESTLIPLSTN